MCRAAAARDLNGTQRRSNLTRASSVVDIVGGMQAEKKEVAATARKKLADDLKIFQVHTYNRERAQHAPARTSICGTRVPV